jgi:hypothetical protein
VLVAFTFWKSPPCAGDAVALGVAVGAGDGDGVAVACPFCSGATDVPPPHPANAQAEMTQSKNARIRDTETSERTRAYRSGRLKTPPAIARVTSLQFELPPANSGRAAAPQPLKFSARIAALRK